MQDLILSVKKINKELSSIVDSGILLTSNEIKYFIKLLTYLENKEILLKGTTKKSNYSGGRIAW